MITFIIGILILILGGFFYGKLVEKIFAPDERETPAYEKKDSLDYEPLKLWKTFCISFLTVSGISAVTGAIQGILFGPLAFLIIPITAIIFGAMHYYLAGMMQVRNGGAEMSVLIRKYLNKPLSKLYKILLSLTLFFSAAIMVYEAGELIAKEVLRIEGPFQIIFSFASFAFIILIYSITVVFPINKFIGRFYPLFFVLVLFSISAILTYIFTSQFKMTEIFSNWDSLASDGSQGFDYKMYFGRNVFSGHHFIPVFFVMLGSAFFSGINSSQSLIVSRILSSEMDGKKAFMTPMLCQGFISLCSAAAAMLLINGGAGNGGISMRFDNVSQSWIFMKLSDSGQFSQIGISAVISMICNSAFGSIAGAIALAGIAILPITTGGTAIRTLRIMISETFHLSQATKQERIRVSSPIFSLLFMTVIYLKTHNDFFKWLWDYESVMGMILGLFVLSAITIYLFIRGKKRYIFVTMTPGFIAAFIAASYICHGNPGLNMSWTASYIIAAILSASYVGLTIWYGKSIIDRLKAL